MGIELKTKTGNVQLTAPRATGSVDLSNYYTKTQVDELLDSYVTQDDLDSRLNYYYDREDIDFALSEYVEEDILAEILTDIPTIEQMNAAIDAVDITEQLGEYARIEYVDDSIAAIPKPNMSNYYTKTETEGLIPDVSGFATREEIPDVAPYQTEEQVNSLIDAALSAIGVAEDGAY